VRNTKQFIDDLSRLALVDNRDAGKDGAPPFVSAFVSRNRETFVELAMPAAGLVIVIEGRKELYWGGSRYLYYPGEAFVLPAGCCASVVNEPDQTSGFYRALFIRFPRELIIEAARLWPQLAKRPLVTIPSVKIDFTLCSAIIHCGEVLSRALSSSRRVVDHRVLEVLLLLAEQGALPLASKYFDGSVSDKIRLLVRSRPAFRWNAVAIAAELTMSQATLHRRLRQEGKALITVLREERMMIAREILTEGKADIAEAIAAAGYVSRSHFARSFRKAFGSAPSDFRSSQVIDR